MLGVGGVKALRALGITPGVYHLNEGHSAFGPLEVDPRADARRRHAVSTTPCAKSPSTPSSPRTRRCPPGTTASTAAWSKSIWARCAISSASRYEQLMGLGRVEPQNDGEPFCMTVVGPQAVAAGQRREPACTATSRAACGPISGRGASKKKFPSATSPTACTFPRWLAQQMLQLYDRHFPGRLDLPHGRAGSLAEHPQRRSGRAVGNAQRAEEPAAGVRPPPRQPAVPPPRRKRRRGRGRPQRARPERADDRLRPPLRHVQAGRR